MRLRVGAGTDTGRLRPLNEDAYMSRADDGLFVVCDGMGGAPAGEVASRMAIDAIVRRIGDAPADLRGGAPDRLRPHTRRLADALRSSNEYIYDQARRDPQRAGMGTTAVGAWIRGEVAAVAHVGDSRAYLWHAHTLVPLTRDHSLFEARVAAGLPHEADGGGRNVLLRALGCEPDVDVEVREVPVRPGDYVLLCSDGLTRMVPDAELARAIEHHQEPQRICDHLIAAANRNGGADNITVVVIEVAGPWWRRLRVPWTRWAGRGHDVEAHAAV